MSSGSQIFLGGVGRTGTQAIAVMLHAIPSIFVLDEPRFLCVAGGVPSLLNGDISFQHLVDNVATHFNQFVGNYPTELWKLPGVYTTKKIREAFGKNISNDANFADKLYQLIGTYVELGMKSVDRTQWAVKEPGIVSQVPWASEVFHRFKLVHIIREPKDTCCSVITKHWGKQGLEWAAFNYQKHLRMALRGLPGGDWVKERNIYVISLENFLACPDVHVKRLLSFLDLSLEPEMVQKLIDNVDSSRSRRGRWMEDLSIAQAHLVDSVCNSVYYDFIQYERECANHEQEYMNER